MQRSRSGRRATGVSCAIGMIAIALAGCGSRPDPIPPCDAADESSGRVFCGLSNPEDLAIWPGRAWVVVSEMGRTGPEAEADAPPDSAGRLLAIRLSDGTRRRLHPPDQTGPLARPPLDPGTEGLGDPACPGPPDPLHFEPHGIDVGTTQSGVDVLAVVNHGGREAVEIFEIDSAPRPGLAWRGCVPMPDGIMTNDVAWHPDGGFVVTNFMPDPTSGRLGMLWTGFRVATGRDTGSVLRWIPGQGVSEIAGSEASAPNGVAVSRDGTEIFVAEWGANRVVRLRLDAGERSMRDFVELEHSPDNLSWTRDGRLLVAGQAGGLRAVLACGEIESGGCGLGYGVYAIDPVSFEATWLFEGLGAASVALEVDSEILVGHFVGDRIDRVPRPH